MISKRPIKKNELKENYTKFIDNKSYTYVTSAIRDELDQYFHLSP